MDEALLLAQGYRKYRGEEFDIYYNKEVCQHAGFCVHGDPAVFDVDRTPWILPSEGTVESIKQIIKRCPSGALKYRLKQSDQILPQEDEK